MEPRMIRLHPKTGQRLLRLRREAEQEGEYRVARRIHAVLLNADGKTSGELAGLLKAPRSRISEWLRNYSDWGMEGLLEGCRSGRPSLMEEAQKVALGDIIESGPAAYGLDSGVWTSPMIGRVILDEFGIDYHSGHVRKLLRGMGFSVQRPRRVLARADPAAQNRWHRRIFPSIKKKRDAKAQR